MSIQIYRNALLLVDDDENDAVEMMVFTPTYYGDANRIFVETMRLMRKGASFLAAAKAAVVMIIIDPHGAPERFYPGYSLEELLTYRELEKDALGDTVLSELATR